MANDPNNLVLTSAITKGRGLRIDNEDCELIMIDHDSSTTVTLVPTLQRVDAAQFFDWDGSVLAPVVTGIGQQKTGLVVTGLPANNHGILAVLKGSKG